MGRAPCCDKANVKKGPWSPEEDAKLKDYIDKYGTGGNWIALPQKIGLKRCGKSCRLRWLNYLRPNIKHGGFSEEEDNIILSLYISIGSRWSIIAAQLPGRTDNDIKNYWNTRLKKKLLGRQKQMNRQDSMNDSSDNTNKNSQTLSNSALERLQLHMQLQNLQNPFSSFYNNPLLWPKLHPLQEKMVQQTLLDAPDATPNYTSQGEDLKLGSQENSQKSWQVDHSKLVDIGDTLNGNRVLSLSPDCCNLMDSTLISPRPQALEQQSVNPVRNFQPDVDFFLENRSFSLAVPQDFQIANFDFPREMNNGSQESSAWWSNEFNRKPTSSSSWDSASVLDQTDSRIMLQDYAHLSYNSM